jgi:DNA modification methylase
MKKSNKGLDEFKPEATTIWDFPDRGAWATHKADYRGNFAPQIPRNLILNYSSEGELVLDPMAGSGTTLIEARLLNRNAVGYDINQRAVDITQERLDFPVDVKAKQTAAVGDVRCLDNIESGSVDLIVTHPPYWNIISYSDGRNPNDLSSFRKLPEYLTELGKGVGELYRVLKPDHYCAILIGDTRKGQHFLPLSYLVLQRCLKSGFVLKEDVIKTQHNTTLGRRWSGGARHYKFYLIMHEHLFVFRKPEQKEKLSRIRYSTWNGMTQLL